MHDQLLLDAVEALERQVNYQTQIGGNPLARELGRFVLNVNPYVDRRSEHLGVAERHYNANLRQEGQLIEQQRCTHNVTKFNPSGTYSWTGILKKLKRVFIRYLY